MNDMPQPFVWLMYLVVFALAVFIVIWLLRQIGVAI